MTPSPRPVDPAPLTREAAEALAAALVGEMIQLWRRGERALPEVFLNRYPSLWEHPEAAADLIYEEMSLRREYGPEAPMEDVLQRFPQWRTQLGVLFDCHRVLAPPSALRFPAAGETVDDFLLTAEIGSGALGRVFLASQNSLADRPVVLKFTPREALEHLSLARLQHTHIVPLYSAQDHSDRGLRSMCMPYFGGAALSRLLEIMRTIPPARRTGRDLLNALDQVEAKAAVVQPVRGGARRGLTRAGYVEAVCWIGACLADALQYAHDHGLVHLDLKPSNVLLAADGQPMLLDFHLARQPIRAGGEGLHAFGGTPGYMSPEQHEALQALQEGRQIERPVDERSDVYSLGVVLYEMLAGQLPVRGENVRVVRRHNAQVSVGLADVIGKCIAADPAFRYGSAAGLAADLRRHLADLPLSGVRNRSLMERWRKWRRRRPYAAAFTGMALAVLTAVLTAAVGVAGYFTQRIEGAREALDGGRVQLARGEWEGAANTFRQGLTAVRSLPFQQDLADELGRQEESANRARASADRSAVARELHRLADRARYLYGASDLAPDSLRTLDASCRAFWDDRARVVALLTDGAELVPQVRDDMLDLAIFCADLRLRLAQPGERDEARGQAVQVLTEAEALFGSSPVLDEERAFYGAPAPERRRTPTPLTAWEHCALGRSLLRAGALEQAAKEMEQAVRLRPQDLWPNFFLGQSAYRLGRYADAVTAYSVCIGAAPEAAPCFYNRALAFDGLGRSEQACQDYDQALNLDPTLAAAALNRGVLHYRAKRYEAALTDLHLARELGADPAVVSFDLSLVDQARGKDAFPSH